MVERMHVMGTISSRGRQNVDQQTTDLEDYCGKRKGKHKTEDFIIGLYLCFYLNFYSSILI